MATASESTDTYRFSKKTTRLQFNLFETRKEAYVNIPVLSNSREIEETHRWKIVYDTSEVEHREGNDRVICLFHVSGKGIGAMKYDKAFFEVKVLNTSGVVLCHKRADLAEPEYKQFNFKKKAQSTDYSEMVFVEIKFECYPLLVVELIEPIQTLLDKGFSTDAAIKTKSQLFPCHKSSLTSKCDYFRFLLESSRKKPVEVNWIEFANEDTVRDMLHYIYTGQEPPNLSKTWAPLMRVSRVCLLDELSVMCHSYVETTISVDNMAEYLITTFKHQCEELQDFVINYIVDNYDSNGNLPPPWGALEPDMAKQLNDRVLTVMVSKKFHV